MKLTASQLRQLKEEGWLLLPEYFSAVEVAILKREADRVLRLKDREEICFEKDGVTPRSAFGIHRYSEIFETLRRHPRLVEPLMQVYGEPVYAHQFKVNAKSKFAGAVWQWHQDYGNWREKDGMPEAKAMNISLFLDEVFPFNGPLMLVPKSHTRGVLPSQQDTETTTFPLFTQADALVEELCKQGGLVAPTGKPGSVLLFDSNLVHGSSGNMTPYPRKILYLSLNACSNYIRTPTRPDYIAHTDFTPIDLLNDDALLAFSSD